MALSFERFISHCLKVVSRQNEQLTAGTKMTAYKLEGVLRHGNTLVFVLLFLLLKPLCFPLILPLPSLTASLPATMLPLTNLALAPLTSFNPLLSPHRILIHCTFLNLNPPPHLLSF